MKNNKFIYVLLFILSVSISAYMLMLQDSEVASVLYDEASSDVPEHYYCPMHPHVQDDQAGSCPICGMDLVLYAASSSSTEDHQIADDSQSEEPVAGDNQDRSTVIRSGMQKAIGMVTAQVVEREIGYRLRSFARVAVDAELYRAQSEYLELGSSRLKSKLSSVSTPGDVGWDEMLQAARMKLKALGLSEQHIISLEQKGQPESSLLTSQTSDPLIIYAYVSESDLAHVHQGQEVRVWVAGHHERSHKARVMFIDHLVDLRSRFVTVRVELLEKNHGLRSGSFVQVEFIAPPQRYVTVPYDSLLQRSDGAYIFVDEGSKFSIRKVNVLFITEESVAIDNREYLGEDIIRHSQFLLDADTRFNATSAGGAGEGGAAGSSHHHSSSVGEEGESDDR